MHEDIKNTAIPFAGYLYQNQQGLRVLCDWLDAPTRYRGVMFECDDEAAAPKGLEDIVVKRSDGLFDFKQIKFTLNPDVHLLSLEWILDKKTGKTEQSRSMLRKLFDTFKKLNPACVGDISLTTNRRPNAEIEACLDGDKISFDKIPEPKRSEIITELGSVQDCEIFFSYLHIRHSDKGYDTLEHEIDDRLRKHGTPEGIAVLKNAAIKWAMQKNAPPPNGWITLSEIYSILRAAPPEPLPEDFIVPKSYEVPDAIFHREFLQEILAASGKVVVLTGPPGRGKSTYLSKLYDTLVEQDIPTVRHHYYLSTTERRRNRVHSYIVEQSIKTQVERFYPDVPRVPESLRALLEACAVHYKALGKPFVLIIDGLDHVWRINDMDTSPLDDLFSQVVPCPENMVLLVGTQPVDDAQLPADLLISSPKDEWRTLPTMSGDAVLSYLRKVVQEGRLTTDFEHEQQAEAQLEDAAAELRARTNGHPLHVIYATAELEHAGGKLSKWDVEQLRGDLSKDVKWYYASLWERLPSNLKDTLRLVCEFQFFWPRTAFAEIANALKLKVPEIEKVEHLLYASPAGLKVFHESLAVYVRSTKDYADRIKELRPEVARWLETSAPKSLRVNWLWTIQAKLGNPKNLINGLTRDWIMFRLEEGYPESLFDVLLTDALIAALNLGEFAESYRLAHLKARMVDGSESQIQNGDMARLVSFTLTLAVQESVVREAVASRHDAEILRVAALGLALQARGNQVLAKTCGEEALRRYRGFIKFSNRYASSIDPDEPRFLADAFARLGTIGATPEGLADLINRKDLGLWLPRVRILVEEGKLEDLMTLVASQPPSENKNIISDACIRAAAQAGVSICEREDFDRLSRTPFVAAVEVAYTRDTKPLKSPIPIEWLKGDYHERKNALSTLLHHWFFSTVHLGLCMAVEGQTEFNYVRAPVYKDRENITDFLNALSSIAVQITHLWWRGEFVDFHYLYELLDAVKFRHFRQNDNLNSVAEDFRNALHRIACDIRLCSVLLNNVNDTVLSEETIKAASKFRWFDSASFRTQYAAGTLTKMADNAAAAFVKSQRAPLDAEVRQETNVRLQTHLQLCAIALAHGLTQEAREFCRQTWELTTGYSHRKDPTLNNTLKAIDYLVDATPNDALRLLGCIAPQIHQVLQYTDGKGTRHVSAAADTLLAKLSPSALIAKYEEHIHLGDLLDAKNSLRAYVEQGVKKGWSLNALMRIGLHPEIRDVLQRIAQDGNPDATEFLRVLEEHAGWDIGVLERREHSESDINRKSYTGDVTIFEPEELQKLLESLPKSYDERTKFLCIWYQYWEAKGQGRRLLDALDGPLFSKEIPMDEVLDLSELAFHTRRKLSGKNKAWDYLVHAHIQKGAWSGFAERNEKTRARLDLVLQYYPNLCDEFVTSTTLSRFGKPVPPRIAPNEVMVYFYVRQGRIAEAVRFAETMVNCVIEDTHTLPLESPRWAAELSTSSIGLAWWMTFTSSSPFWDGRRPPHGGEPCKSWRFDRARPATKNRTHAMLLHLLCTQKPESEVMEVLSIFWMVIRGYDYTPVAKLVNSIQKPSLISNLILDDLGFPTRVSDADLKEAPYEFEIPDNFNSMQGVDLPSWVAGLRIANWCFNLALDLKDGDI